MRLIQMAYLDLEPPPRLDHPALSIKVDEVTVTWVARWANPLGSWTGFQKIDEEHHRLRARLAFAHSSIEAACPISDLATEDGLPLTPDWLTPPLRRSRLVSTKKGEMTASQTQVFDVYTSATEIVMADITLKERPSKNEQGLLEIDNQILRRSVTAIEVLADLLSVAGRSKRTIGSPIPPIALVAENDRELSWLRKSKGIANLGSVQVVHKQQYEFDLSGVPPGALDDRTDGVKLLADVFSQSWPTGRFRELCRFFERAFSAPTGQLVVPLADFLKGEDPQFTRSEIQKWIALRGPVVHGDRRENFALSVDVMPILPRMEYAAYDVLLFKEQWRSTSSARRVLQDVPTSLMEEPRGGSGPKTTTLQITDRQRTYEVYPILGCGPLRLTQPEWPVTVPGMWAKGPGGASNVGDAPASADQ